MSKKMLVDASHPEEVRLVVCNKGLIEDFEYQSSLRHSLKGNVYLAKVSKVEPSLQAAFIEYGGGRQGFLPFAEIHPDYYQIPAADKEKLLQQMIDEAKKESELEESEDDKEHSDIDQEQLEDIESSSVETTTHEKKSRTQNKKSGYWQKYKIQEVIKKDQIILVQVEKDERGVKGVTLTTYISLAGRYCVLMPNSTSTGGISRKVSDNKEKKRMKAIVSELISDKPSTSLILRTAGAYKSKVEIKRDFTYLSKLWDNIRSHTLASKAPTFIHDESNMMKYAIRDLYTNDIEEIIVSGNPAYKEIYSAMEMFMPKHLNRVIEYTSPNPIFTQYYNIESQIASLYSPSVQLPSGGYIVINQTEALVSIDVNSGKSNKERNIENTALNTNIEAATEIARQLRLRDLSGLIVIDFIDMGDYKHKKIVEAELSDAVSKDRAKIQLGKISSFGLLQMSRQRINQSFIEANTSVCSHCDGRGRVRPVTASAIAVLRAIASEIAGHNFEELHVSVSSDLLIYISNHKRKEILELESMANAKILFFVDEEAGADGFFMKQIKGTKKKIQPMALSSKDLPSYNNSDESVDEEEVIPQPISQEKRRLRNSNKKNWRNAKNNATNLETEESQINVSHESDIASGSNERKKSRKNKRKGKFNKKDMQPYDAESINNSGSNESTAEKPTKVKTEQNQSLLREIWKKFVD